MILGAQASGVADAAFILYVVALAVACAALGALRVYVLEPDRARQRYRQLKADQEPQTVELSDEGLRFGSELGEKSLSLPWQMISQWRQNDQFVFIYMMPTYNMPKLHFQLPKSVAEQGFDIPLLVQRLAERVGPERW